MVAEGFGDNKLFGGLGARPVTTSSKVQKPEFVRQYVNATRML